MPGQTTIDNVATTDMRNRAAHDRVKAPTIKLVNDGTNVTLSIVFPHGATLQLDQTVVGTHTNLSFTPYQIENLLNGRAKDSGTGGF